MSGTIGVEIAGTGRYIPKGVTTNDDFSKLIDTSDEWIVQRTGIRQRHFCDAELGETTHTISQWAPEKAIEDAGIDAAEIDLLILATVTGEMRCPATACRVASDVGAVNAGAFDLLAACSGFVYGMNLANSLIRTGSMKTIAVVGCDVMSRVLDMQNRSVAVLFGDSAGAAIVRATDDASMGMRIGSMKANGSGWKELFIPERVCDLPESVDESSITKMGTLQMNGREVYKFAVGTFPQLIADTLERGNVTVDDVDMFVCHQSNARMLESARERFGIPKEKMYVNIDRYGNCSAGSVPVCLDELRKSDQGKPGDLVMFVAFGGGLTWSSLLWQL